MTPNLLTVQRLAQLFNVSAEDITLAIAMDPKVREIARADGTRIYDREAADVIRYRLEKMDSETGEGVDDE